MRCSAQPRRIFEQCLKDRLQVERRTTYHLEHFAGRRLLVQCFSQVTVTLLQFLEQPHVLDRDDGLIREGLEKGNLLFCEGTNLCTANMNRSDRNPSRRNGVTKVGPHADGLTDSLGLPGNSAWVSALDRSWMWMVLRSIIARPRGPRRFIDLNFLGPGNRHRSMRRYKPKLVAIRAPIAASLASHSRAALLRQCPTPAGYPSATWR